MKRTTRLICSIAIAIALIAGFVYWEKASLSAALRTMPVGGARGALVVDTLSAQVLGAGLNEPVSDQLVRSPAYARQRYALVTTWIHASKIFKSLNNNPPPEGVMLSSASLTNLSAENRVDAWGNPYCLVTEHKQMIFLSSAGKGVLNCEEMRETAQQAASKAIDARLTKEGNLLVAVYKRARDVSAIHPSR
jgi:hypothetical protein